MTTKITRHITKHPPSGPQSWLQDLEIWTGSVSVCDEKSFFLQISQLSQTGRSPCFNCRRISPLFGCANLNLNSKGIRILQPLANCGVFFR